MRRIASVIVLCTMPMMAVAEMSYTYVEIGAEFGDLEIGTTEFDSTEFSGEISVGVHKNVAVMVSGGVADVDVPSPFDLSSSGVGFGVLGHIPASAKIDVMFGAGVGRSEVELSDGVTTLSEDDTAKHLYAGVRGQVADRIEAEARVVSTDVFDERSESYALVVRFGFNEKVSGAINYSWADGYSGLGYGLRVDF